MVHTIEKKFFLLWHDSYRMYILAHFMPADEYRAYFSLRTYADPIHAAPCSEQMAKAVYTAGYQAGQNTFSSVPGIPYGYGSFLFYADWGIMGIF